MEILEFDVAKSISIILAVLLYWKFVYYKYHEKDITPISFIVGGGALAIYGFYAYYFEKSISFNNIVPTIYIFLAFAVFSFISLLFVVHKWGLHKGNDITLTWLKKTFPFVPYWFWMIAVLPAFFFIMIATYKFLAKEYILFWIMILLAWIRSNIRLYKNYILKCSNNL